MKNQLESLEQFQKAYNSVHNDKPSLIDEKDYKLRFELMKEENEEYLEACEENNMVEIADALADKLYILCGTIVSHGMQHIIDDLFTEVHRSNMSKLGPDGKPIYREDGKILKGENYSAPELKSIIYKNTTK